MQRVLATTLHTILASKLLHFLPDHWQRRCRIATQTPGTAPPPAALLGDADGCSQVPQPHHTFINNSLLLSSLSTMPDFPGKRLHFLLFGRNYMARFNSSPTAVSQLAHYLAQTLASLS